MPCESTGVCRGRIPLWRRVRFVARIGMDVALELFQDVKSFITCTLCGARSVRERPVSQRYGHLFA